MSKIPLKYKSLDNNVFCNGEYTLVPIRYEDRLDIMKWRNEQIYHLRQKELLTEENQDEYFNTVVKDLYNQETPNQILFSYLEDGICIGYGGLVHINWIDKNAEISFVMNTVLENNKFEFHWNIYLGLIEQVAFNTLNLHKIFTYAFDLRPHLYLALEKSGYIQEAVLKEHCLIDGEYIDVVIHSKFWISERIVFRKITHTDCRLLFTWSNDELVRLQSYESQKINYSEHQKWFNQKVTDKNSFYHIAILKKKKIGLVRFDIKNTETIIGILINNEFRGKGLGVEILINATKLYFSKYNLPIIAYIKSNNVASIKSFERAGFILEEETTVKDTRSLIYKLKQ